MKTSVSLLIALTLFINSAIFAATYGGGTGEPNNPYQIWTPQQMNTIGVNPADWDKCFILMADISMAAYTGTQYNIIGAGYPLDNPFTGKFDGNNHKISNLTYIDTTKQAVGLFGYTESGAEIKNLGLENINITGDIRTGGLIGTNNGTVYNCYSSGSVNGVKSIGGLIGGNNGPVTNCYSTGSVTGNNYVGGLTGCDNWGASDSYFIGSVDGNDYVGGLAGYVYSYLSNCYSTGTVSGHYSVGGLIGYTDDGSTVNNCYSNSIVSGTGAVGGLAGRNSAAIIRNCYSTGSVSATENGIGGLVGANTGWLENCYSNSDVSGNSYVGGLTGYFDAFDVLVTTRVKNCYSTGNVNGNTNVGGLIGYFGDYSIITACFWDVNSSGLVNGVGRGSSTGVYGRTTTQMKQQATFTMSPYLWDFLGESTNGANDYWRMCVDNVNYPKLTWEYTKNGDFACPDGISYDDLQRLSNDWLVTYGYPKELYGADASGDKTVNFLDFAILAENWLQ